MAEAAEMHECPAIVHKPFIGSHNARELAIRSHVLRKQRKAALAAEAEAKLPAPQPNFTGARVAQVEAEIERQHSILATATDPKAIRDLTTALDKLYQNWALLTGHERPGVRRSQPRRPLSQRPAAIVPLDPEQV